MHFKCFAAYCLDGRTEQKRGKMLECRPKMHNCGSSWAVGHMKSVLMYLLFVWGALVSNNKTELMCSLLHWITGLYFIWRAACFHKGCRNRIPLRSLAFYLMWLKLVNGLYNYWEELWQHRQKYMQRKFIHHFLLCFYHLESWFYFFFLFK